MNQSDAAVRDLVSTQELEASVAHLCSLGEKVSVTTPSGSKRAYEVRGVYDPPSISPLRSRNAWTPS